MPVCFSSVAEMYHLRMLDGPNFMDLGLNRVVIGSPTKLWRSDVSVVNFWGFALMHAVDPDVLFRRGSLLDLVMFANLACIDETESMLWFSSPALYPNSQMSGGLFAECGDVPSFQAKPVLRSADLCAVVRMMEPRAPFFFEMMHLLGNIELPTGIGRLVPGSSAREELVWRDVWDSSVADFLVRTEPSAGSLGDVSA